MKGSDKFNTAIEDYLNDRAQGDTAFAQHYSKASKNLESCFNYIFGEVKKTGYCGFDNQEIFDMAVRYYEDDSIGVPASVKCRVEVNKPAENDLFSCPADVAQPAVTLGQGNVFESTVPENDTAETGEIAITHDDDVVKTEPSAVKSDIKTVVTGRKADSKTLTLFDL
ncbi:PcfK-like family protein [Flavobacterium olei]|uniref:PcfK-like family protein n=1 Tax=Flavobacterium olei TaxID=1886782 RepID=UPI00321ABA65